MLLSSIPSAPASRGVSSHPASAIVKPPRGPGHRRYQLNLMGAFRLITPDGERLDISSKKAIALLALLATAETGERWRAWLQEKLWGSLEPHQAQGGLRRELHRLRKLTDDLGVPLLHCDFRAVRLNVAAVDVDIRREGGAALGEDFLEGIDIPREDAFEDWLRETRHAFY